MAQRLPTAYGLDDQFLQTPNHTHRKAVEKAAESAAQKAAEMASAAAEAGWGAEDGAVAGADADADVPAALLPDAEDFNNVIIVFHGEHFAADEEEGDSDGGTAPEHKKQESGWASPRPEEGGSGTGGDHSDSSSEAESVESLDSEFGPEGFQAFTGAAAYEADAEEEESESKKGGNEEGGSEKGGSEKGGNEEGGNEKGGEPGFQEGHVPAFEAAEPSSEGWGSTFTAAAAASAAEQPATDNDTFAGQWNQSPAPRQQVKKNFRPLRGWPPSVNLKHHVKHGFQPDSDWPPQPDEQPMLWPSKANWPSMRRDLDAIQYPRCRQPLPPLPPGEKPDTVQFGTLTRTDAEAPAARPRKEKADKQQFANKYERERYFSEHEHRTRERKLAEAEEAAKAAKAEIEAAQAAKAAKAAKTAEAKGYARVAASVKIQADDSAAEPHIILETRANFNTATQQKTVRGQTILTPDCFAECQNAESRDPKTRMLHPDTFPTSFASCDIIDATDDEQWQEFCELSPAQDLEELRPRLGAQFASVWLEVQPDGVYGREVFSEQPGAFGPLQPQFDRLKQVSQRPFSVNILVPDGPRLRETMLRWCFSVNRQHVYKSANFKHWADRPGLAFQKGVALQRHQRPRFVRDAVPTFSNHLHHMSMEALAAEDDAEFQQEESGKVCRKAKARVVLVKGGGDGENLRKGATQILLMVDLVGAENPRALKIGDHVVVRIRRLNPTNDNAINLSGKVVVSPQLAHPADTALLVNTARDDVTGEHVQLDVTPLADDIPIDGELDTSEKQIWALQHQTAHLVDIAGNTDKATAKRIRAAFWDFDKQVRREMEQDTEHRRSATSELFCGGRPHILPKVNVLASMKPETVDAFKKSLSEDQAQVLPVMEAAPCATVVIKGPPGSGKSTLLRGIVKMVTANGKQVVVVSGLNRLLDSHTVMVAELLRDSPGLRIVRVMGKNTEKQIVKRMSPASETIGSLKTGSVDQTERDAFFHSVESLSAALLMYDWHLDATSRRFRVRDDRLNDENLAHTIGWHILHNCGMLTGGAPADPHWSRLRDMLDALLLRDRILASPNSSAEDVAAQRDKWGKRQHQALGDQIADCTRAILLRSDVILASAHHAGEQRVADWLQNVGAVCIDELTRLSAWQLVGIWAAWPDAPKYIVGDPNQLRIINTVPAGYGTSTAQLGIPPPIGWIMGGIRHVVLARTQRFGHDMCSLLSPLFWDDSMRPDPSFAYSDHQKKRMASFKRGFDEQTRKGNAIFLVNIPGTAETTVGHTSTRTNAKTSQASIDAAFKVARDHGYAGHEIQIIAAYSGQVKQTKSRITELCKRHGEGDGRDARAWRELAEAGDALVTTVDNALGAQAPFTIVDLVAADGPGFTNKADRLATALSRGQEIVLIFADVDKITKGLRDVAPLMKLINALKKRHAYIRLPPPAKIIVEAFAAAPVARDPTNYRQERPGEVVDDLGTLVASTGEPEEEKQSWPSKGGEKAEFFDDSEDEAGDDDQAGNWDGAAPACDW